MNNAFQNKRNLVRGIVLHFNAWGNGINQLLIFVSAFNLLHLCCWKYMREKLNLHRYIRREQRGQLTEPGETSRTLRTMGLEECNVGEEVSSSPI